MGLRTCFLSSVYGVRQTDTLNSNPEIVYSSCVHQIILHWLTLVNKSLQHSKKKGNVVQIEQIFHNLTSLYLCYFKYILYIMYVCVYIYIWHVTCLCFLQNIFLNDNDIKFSMWNYVSFGFIFYSLNTLRKIEGR